jgi:N-acetyl-anhydromuramoyl-L-alanine amidase
MIKKFIKTPFKKSRGNYPLDTVVIHHIGSSKGKLYGVKGTITWFTNLEVHRNKETGKIENQVSAHYVIPREPYRGADVVQHAKHEDITYHAGRSSWKYKDNTKKVGLNKYSIGIELAGDGNLVAYTEFQYETLIELLKEIISEHNIPVENIVGHEDISPGRKVDPGKFFEWGRVRDALMKTTIEMPEIIIKPEDAEETAAVPFDMDQGSEASDTDPKAEIFFKIIDFLRRVLNALIKK